ncbi:MAG: hypothetical protein ABJQ41_02990 [Marinomonas sp.]
MMKFGAFFVGMAAFMLAACNPVEVLDETDTLVDRYQAHWNGGRIDPIWIEADEEFRGNVSKAQYAALMTDFQQILGDVKKSERASFNVNSDNGVTTVKVAMNTQFANGTGVEKFEFIEREGKMGLKAYHVESGLLEGYDFSQHDGLADKPADEAAPAE